MKDMKKVSSPEEDKWLTEATAALEEMQKQLQGLRSAGAFIQYHYEALQRRIDEQNDKTFKGE